MKLLTNIAVAVILTFTFITYVSSCADADAKRSQIIQCMNGDRSELAYAYCLDALEGE